MGGLLIAQLHDLSYSYLDFCIDHPRQEGNIKYVSEPVDVKEQNFNQQPANHMSASCQPAFVNFLQAKTHKVNHI